MISLENKPNPPNTSKGRFKYLKPIILFLGSVWLILALCQAPVVTMKASSQIHGMWMTHLSAALMYYMSQLDEVMATLAQHHINTLYPCVWNRGQTLYPSDVVEKAGGVRQDPLTKLPLSPWHDPLEGLIKQAHRQQVRILPWFEYGLMIPATSTLAHAHPDWLTTDAAGNFVVDPMTPLSFLPKSLKDLQLELTGGNIAWLNPFHPEVQAFLTKLIQEVVERYAVDGIQLDDHFGLPIEMGYDRYTQQLYQADHGGAAPPSDPSDASWVAWRAERITQFLAKIARAVKTSNPQAIVSISPNPPEFAYQKYLQDWLNWVDQGIVDEVIVQLYRRDLAIFEHDLYQSGFYHLRHRVPIAIGIYTGPIKQPQPIAQVTAQIKAVKSSEYKGVAFFSWETTLGVFKQHSTKEDQQRFLELL